MSASQLSACVVGVSGGVDSAVVLAILNEASKRPGSPIKKVVAASLPLFAKKGSSNQAIATDRGQEAAQAFGADYVVLELTQAHAALSHHGDSASRIEADGWAAGQLVAYLRTSALFYLATLQFKNGNAAVVCGTTNRDEGAYIGYFGKASDGMVDLQIISDLHKDEVYQMAEMLSVPASIRDAIPTGDGFDALTDEELLRVPYDFIELYTHYLCLDDSDRTRAKLPWSEDDHSVFNELARQMEVLHSKCSHKYIGESPAIHFDVYERAVPGGWRDLVAMDESSGASRLRPNFAGEFHLDPNVLRHFESRPLVSTPDPKPFSELGTSGYFSPGILSAEECSMIRHEVERQSWVPVGSNGVLADYDPSKDLVGSYWVRLFNERFAKLIWERVRGILPTVRMMDEQTPTDWEGERVWRATGINPLLRFIRYEKSGVLIPHYDLPYVESESKRTLMTLIIYLNDAPNGSGGATRFINDPQRRLPLSDRDYRDWETNASEKDILFSVEPAQGAAFAFDHRILHDAQVILGETRKIILRTDIFFERCGMPRKKSASVCRAIAMPDAPVLSANETSQSLAHSELSADETRIWAQIAKDPLYGSAAQRFHPKSVAIQKMKEAGYLDLPQAQEIQTEAEWLTTPTHKIMAQLEEVRNNGSLHQSHRPLVVLLATGGFCPVHESHLEMMELAKRELEDRGAIVLGGYLSPSHDEYISAKCGPDALSAAHRVRLCQEATLSHPWLAVDSWESLHNSRLLNFSDVIMRLEKYLNTHVRTHRPIEVAYVFGGDNAAFARAFSERGRCVCIQRRGAEDRFEEIRSEMVSFASPRVVFAHSSTRFPGLSSTQVRQGGDAAIPEAARDLFKEWKSIHQASHSTNDKHRYLLRDEGDFSIAKWTQNRSHQEVERARVRFNLGLANALKSEFAFARWPDRSRSIEVEFVSAQLQHQKIAELRREFPVISLDPCISGDHNIEISRCFALASGKGRIGMVARPGSLALDDQIRAIPAGTYILVDDDTVTGTTLRSVRSMLPSHVRIERFVPLVEIPKSNSPTVLDISDCRDFLLGANQAGLVVELPNGEIARAPYLMPYVSLSDRARAPISREREFSMAVLGLNIEFFASLSKPVTLAEADPGFRSLMSYIGFKDDMGMLEICQWHLKRIQLGESFIRVASSKTG